MGNQPEKSAEIIVSAQLNAEKDQTLTGFK